MNNSTYRKFVSEIKKLEKKRDADILKCNNLIAEKEAVIQEAEKSINAETEVDDFLKASVSKAEAETVIDACKKKIDLIKTKGVLPDEEYMHDLDSIRFEQKTICENAIPRMTELLNELFGFYDEVHGQVEGFNELALQLSRLAQKKNVIFTYNNDLYSFMNKTVGWLEQRIRSDKTYSKLIKNQ